MSTVGPGPRGWFAHLTNRGPAAIAILRIWGPAAPKFLTQHVQTRRPIAQLATERAGVARATLTDTAGAPLDDMLLSVHGPPPNWDVRLHLHGNPWLVERCAELLRAAGLAEAAPDARALWPVQDRLDAEAYALLPEMLTLRGARWLLAQPARLRAALAGWAASNSPDDARSAVRHTAERLEIAGWFRRPLRIALVGPPNAGKSTLANAFGDRPASLVSSTPGTTRDWVEIPGECDGFPVAWFDTAGLRPTEDGLEQASNAQTHQLLAAADAAIVVVDATASAADVAEFVAAYGGQQATCVALNKCDLAKAKPDEVRAMLPAAWRPNALAVSGATRTGLDDLTVRLLAAAGRTSERLAGPAAYTPRQAGVLARAAAETKLDQMRPIFQDLITAVEFPPADQSPVGCDAEMSDLA